MPDKPEDEPSPSVVRPIYVVDDHPDMCHSLEALLTSYGFDVICFTNPLEFVQSRDKLSPGVLLLDFRMPEMNGLDVLATIHSDLSRFPTVVITAHGEIDAAVKAIKLGAKDFIQKPFREKALLDVIQSAMDGFAAVGEKSLPLLDELTPREKDVVLSLSRGIPNKVVAHQLGISVRTVEMHRARAMQRLGCKTFADLLRRVFSALSAAP